MTFYLQTDADLEYPVSQTSLDREFLDSAQWRAQSPRIQTRRYPIGGRLFGTGTD